jgi:hypothetical protein
MMDRRSDLRPDMDRQSKALKNLQGLTVSLGAAIIHKVFGRAVQCAGIDRFHIL